ncbi:MAG: GyrI-like domain-containing protein [Anaerolineales bacterium]|nr:GyrI-like domain-containing protein [Anaerolineales bacterium]MCB8961125.1 GyrI-like domain-containing protein [Ardenticatenales bacterium]
MSKIDFKKELKQLYRPSARQFEVVEVPEMQFLMVDGHGNPNTVPAYREAVETLYAVAYKIKFSSKKLLNRDYVVPPLEGLWWAEDMDTFLTRDKDAWDWTMMIMQPDWISTEMFAEGCAAAEKANQPPALSRLRLASYREGLSVQIMHIGSYDDEGPVLAKLHNEFLPGNGYVETGKHHEIYLGDPRKTKPENLKTILRQPVKQI